jgi:uncharacterized phage-associated protein
MSHLTTHNKDQIDKIGNALIYLINQKGNGWLTKKSLLKLIYILEERSIEKTCLPFFNLQYEVWKYGPVAKEVHSELYDDLNLFKSFIEKKSQEDDSVIICAKGEFNNDEFSDNDLDILNEVVNEFKEFTEKELIDYTHREGSLWYISAKENNVLDALLREEEITTKIHIDFSKLFDEKSEYLAHYQSQLEFFNIYSTLK